MCQYEGVVFLALYSTHLLVRWHHSSSFLHVDCGGNNFWTPDCAARFGWFTGEAGCLIRENASKVSQKNVPNSAAECAITSGCRSGNLHSLEGTKLNIVLYLPSSVLVLIDPSKMKPFLFYFSKLSCVIKLERLCILVSTHTHFLCKNLLQTV
jgi:hypothetical protein